MHDSELCDNQVFIHLTNPLPPKNEVIYGQEYMKWSCKFFIRSIIILFMNVHISYSYTLQGRNGN